MIMKDYRLYYKNNNNKQKILILRIMIKKFKNFKNNQHKKRQN